MRIRVAPYFRTLVTPHAREMVNNVLDTGLISYGELSAEFERQFSALHGCRYGVLSNSGTSSLQVAVQAFKEWRGWQDGDEIIVPATTFVASANVVTHNRMVPVFVDVDARTYNLDPALIERALTARTRAIMPVHLLGQPAHMTAIMGIARQHALAVIEDSCEAVFVRHFGHPVGSWGDVGAFSFYAAHSLVAGVGGMGLTNNPNLAGRMRSLVNHGLTLECLSASGDNFRPRPVANREFQFGSIGHSFRVTELEAALALGQLEHHESMLARRQANADYLTRGIAALCQRYGDWIQTPVVAEGNEHSWMMYGLVLRWGDRGSLLAHLAKRGIETRDMLPLLSQPAYRHVRRVDYPVSDNLIRNGFYIGCHQGLETSDLDYILDALADWMCNERS